MRVLFLTLLTLLSSIVCEAQLKTPNIIKDGMVLQQNTAVKLWGTGTPDTEIRIIPSWEKEKYNVTVGKDGKWMAYINTPAGSYTKYEIKIKTKGESILLKDILVGEVWFASGQSNMEMPILGYWNNPTEGAMETITGPDYTDKVRMFTVSNAWAYEPQENVAGEWKDANASNVVKMSATAYYFARKLNEVLKIPVGIVCCAYGGSKVEGWLNKEILDTYPEVSTKKEDIEKCDDWLKPMGMHNGMLYPVKGYTIKGFIWYQGCSNIYAFENYEARLIDLVKLWRSYWGDTENRLPFYLAQIAPFEYSNPVEKGKAPYLRQAQFNASKNIPHSGIIGTNDLVYLYERTCIHPSQKKPVGGRFAYLALHEEYGCSSIYPYCPRAVDSWISEDNHWACIKIEGAPNGVNRVLEVMGLEVALDDKVFYPVTEIFYSWNAGGTLIFEHKNVERPKYVRYCWGDFKPGNIRNCEGLPLLPFEIEIP